VISTDSPGHQPEPGWGHRSGALRLSADISPVPEELLAERPLLAELMYRYGWSFDERQADLLLSCFAQDARWEARIMGATIIGPFEGREAIMDFMTGFWPAQTDQRRHMVTNVLIEDQSPTDATIFSYHLLMSAAGGRVEPVTAGFYKVQATKTEAGWKMKSLLAGYDVPF
jgi:hypothetical protein